ncbi:MAG: cyclase family protein [Patescibacteria group bacterium]
MKFYDISLPIRSGMMVYPGNTEVDITSLPSATSLSSRIVMGSHTGTHIDAPKHVLQKGKGVDTIPLDQIVGPCRVLDMVQCVDSVNLSDLRPYRIKKGERILVKTKNSRRGFKKFRDDFIYLDGDAADFLAQKEIVLFGIDYLSVKKRGSADTRPHTALLKKKIVILEGIDLSRITPGDYFLLCLPLRCAGIDGAPARAVLVR